MLSSLLLGFFLGLGAGKTQALPDVADYVWNFFGALHVGVTLDCTAFGALYPGFIRVRVKVVGGV